MRRLQRPGEAEGGTFAASWVLANVVLYAPPFPRRRHAICEFDRLVAHRQALRVARGAPS